ncbi:MAG: ABC transporter substrate-binding protein [Proteobacteria bacterium]|nr:ABC transporter substrate-binding protein [Pseudomonadota bacterium]
MKSYLRNWLLLLPFALLFILGTSQAQVASPVTVLNTAANQMLASLAQNKAKLKQNPNIIYGIVSKNLLPYVDVDRMSMAVVGRQAWTNATPAQKSEFINQFTHLVTSTYAAALASYDDDRVQFFPLRADFNTSRALTVRSAIIRRTGQKIAVDYNVVRSGDTWKVYDFSIENVSMVQSYRSQFSDVLASQGMNGLLQRLKAHNKNT